MEKNYKPRLIDKKVEDYLSVFGAISIIGPKWCGKTYTSLNHSKSAVYLDDKETKDMALLDVKTIFKGEEELPELIDEWHLVPEIWDAVRRECDKRVRKGNFILTGSTALSKKEEKDKIHHSGIGRIGKIKMYTMSLYESGDSSGKASIMDMYNGIQTSMNTGDVDIKFLAKLIIRGGWPENLMISDNFIDIIPKNYINSILDKDSFEEDDEISKIDKNKMKMLLKSLARNETSTIGNKTILKDIADNEDNFDVLSSRDTIISYLDILDRLHLIENQEAYSENYRSPERIGKSAKKHFTDPSLACAILNLNEDKLMSDLNTFGLMYEALVIRDLRIYMDYLGGNVYHFRDNITGLESDAILEFADGEYAAVEIKLGFRQVEEAKKNLIKFYENMIKKPKFMCIIVGNAKSIAKDSETGIYIVPLTTLKP